MLYKYNKGICGKIIYGTLSALFHERQNISLWHFQNTGFLISVLTWFFILIKNKNPSKTNKQTNTAQNPPKHFNLTPLIFNSRLYSCFLLGSLRKRIEKTFQSNPNSIFFTGFLSSSWPERSLLHTALPITALLMLLAKHRKWGERWCMDRIPTVERSEQGFGLRYCWREERSQATGCKAK